MALKLLLLFQVNIFYNRTNEPQSFITRQEPMRYFLPNYTLGVLNPDVFADKLQHNNLLRFLLT